MPQSWTLLDQDTNSVVPDGWHLDEAALGLPGAEVRVTQHSGGLSQGVTTIQLSNGQLTVSVVPTRGMGLWRLACGDTGLGWKSPVRGPVHPAFVPLAEPSGLGWLDGFDEFLVRCGLESNGAPEFDEQLLAYPLHGRIANRPAHRVQLEAGDDELRLTGQVEETRFHFLKLRLTSTLRLPLAGTTLHIEDRVENLSASAAETQLLYHVNFGPPLLDAGARIVAPAEFVVPRNEHAARDVARWDSYAAPQPGFEEQVYFLKLLADAQGRTLALLRNAHGTLGASLHFDVRQLPCFSVWKNTTSVEDGCVTGLEPGTNYPNPRSFEGRHDRVRRIAPGGEIRYDLSIACHNGADQVQRAERQVAQLQAQQQPRVYDKPQAEWCA